MPSLYNWDYCTLEGRGEDGIEGVTHQTFGPLEDVGDRVGVGQTDQTSWHFASSERSVKYGTFVQRLWCPEVIHHTFTDFIL